MQQIIWQSDALAKALQVNVPKGIETGIVQFNSKDVRPGDLFIALPGSNGDGHDYVSDAFQRGAGAVIISKFSTITPEYENKVIIVSDTMDALAHLATYKRNKIKGKFIGITGSLGKTSTRQALYLMLQAFGQTFASRKNFNNDIGVPLDLASMPDDTEYAIFEMGMRGKGQILRLAKMVKPDIAIITTIAAVHLEFFNDITEIADAKSEIFAGLVKDGTAVINYDIPYTEHLLKNLKNYGVTDIRGFGYENKTSKLNSRLLSYKYIAGRSQIIYNIEGQEVHLTFNELPQHQAINITSALEVIAILKLDLSVAITKLSEIKSLGDRGRLVSTEAHGHKLTILCDYYNASVESMKAAFKYLSQIDNPKKVVVLGHMVELGPNSPQMHESLKEPLLASGVYKIFLYGEHMIYLYTSLIYRSGLQNVIRIEHYNDKENLKMNLKYLLDNDDLVLIKGSRAMKMEEIAQYLGVIDTA